MTLLFLTCKMRLLDCNLSFLMRTFKAMHFPTSAAFAACHKFWHVVCSFPFTAKCFLISFVIFSFTHWLRGSVIFYYHCVICLNTLLLLICNFIPLWLENILWWTNIFRHVWGPSRVPILDNVPCALEKNVHATVGVECSTDNCKKPNCLVLFKSLISLLISA